MLRELQTNTGSGIGVDFVRPNITGPLAYENETAVVFYSVLWGLVREGIIVPGKPARLIPSFVDSSELNFLTLTVTPHGREVLKHPEIIYPSDVARFVQKARERLGEADEVIFTYLAEALNNFRDRSYLSATVMLGVSAEMLMKWLLFRFLDHLPMRQREEWEQTRTKYWMRTDKLFSEFIRALTPHYGELTRDLRYQAEANLDQLQSLIRVNRDDVGHGRPERADAQQVEANLQGYLVLLKLVREIADTLPSPCNAYNA